MNPCRMRLYAYQAAKTRSSGGILEKKKKKTNKTTQGAESYSSIVLINSKAPGKTLAGIEKPHECVWEHYFLTKPNFRTMFKSIIPFRSLPRQINFAS